MKRSKLVVVSLILAVGVASASSARAQDLECFHRCSLTARDVEYVPVADGSSADSDRWTDASCWPPGCGPCVARNPCEFRIGIGVWTPGVDGTITMDGNPTQVDSSWTDWYDNAGDGDFGIQPFITYRTKCWTFGGSYLGMRLGDAVPITNYQGDPLDAEVSANIFKLWIGYELFRRSMSRTNCWPCLTAQVYGGVRIYAMKIEGTFPQIGAPLRTVSSTQEWADPLIGTNLKLDFSSKWAVVLDADVGGFSAGSEISWHVSFALEWRIARWLALQGGWDTLEVDYSEGTGSGAFGYNVRMSGPFLNLVFVF
jgi:hypothetical protein